MKKLAGLTVFVVLVFAFSGIASARDEMWAGGYIEINETGAVAADTFVTIHNPNPPHPSGFKCPRVIVEVYDEDGNILGKADLGGLKPRTAKTVSIASLLSPDGPALTFKKLFLRFQWKRPTLTSVAYKYMYRPWLEVKQVVWLVPDYNPGCYFPNQIFPVLRPTNVRTWTECYIPFNPWYHYYTTWDVAPQ